jgi:hypothetical protein
MLMRGTSHAVGAPLAAGAVFGLAMGLLGSAYYGWRLVLWPAIFAGVAFGLAIAAFARLAASRRMRTPPAFAGEVLLREGPANRFAGIEGVGGWLYLTDRQLFFRPHAINLHRDDWRVAVADISSAAATRTFGVIPNGLRVTTATGAARFVVSGHAAWAEAIAQARKGVVRADA